MIHPAEAVQPLEQIGPEAADKALKRAVVQARDLVDALAAA